MSSTLPTVDEARARLAAPTITPADWAALTDIATRLIYRGLHDGTIPSIRLGQRFRIPSSWAKQQLGLD